MTADDSRDSFNDADTWDLFWSEYMVWSVRLVCLSANEYFFRSVRLSLATTLPHLSIVVLLMAYSIGCLYLIERLFARRYNPTYDYLSLTSEGLHYRVSRERLIYSSLLFSVANIVLGAVTATALASPIEASPIIYGMVGIMSTIFASVIGTICMVARNTKTGRRMPFLYPVGLAASSVPVVFVVLAMRDLFFSPGSSAW